MARILITGSSDGLGSLVAQRLVKNGHSVILHARNAQRAEDASKACPGAETVVTGDLSSLAETKGIAEQVNKLGAIDCVIHNAGLYRGPYRKTSEGIPALAAVNTVAPYVLTSLINRPKRILYLSSGMHYSASPNMDDPLYLKRGESQYSEGDAYCTSKLHNILFAKAFARRWPDVTTSSLDPGWMPTKMGGKAASGDFEDSIASYVMIAEGTDEKTKTSGAYFEPAKKVGTPHNIADDVATQDKLLQACADFSGVKLA